MCGLICKCARPRAMSVGFHVTSSGLSRHFVGSAARYVCCICARFQRFHFFPFAGLMGLAPQGHHGTLLGSWTSDDHSRVKSSTLRSRILECGEPRAHRRQYQVTSTPGTRAGAGAGTGSPVSLCLRLFARRIARSGLLGSGCARVADDLALRRYRVAGL